ncbi:MAG: ribosome-associated translation inhibitor RaiA [Bacteroidota bacterium]|nr:ribosome-associated translation inhibitor RaiA [Bacteroidota bacterium]
MKINITARKFKAHDTLKEYITSEIERLERFNGEIMSSDVILSFQNNKDSVKEVEIVIHIPGQTVTATETSDDFKKSINLAVEKILKQLEKIKTKKTAVRIPND